MVVRWKGVPDTILEVMMLTMGKVLCVAHRHLLTTVPRKEQRGKFKNCHQEAESSTKDTAGVVRLLNGVFNGDGAAGIRRASVARGQGEPPRLSGPFLNHTTNHNVRA